MRGKNEWGCWINKKSNKKCNALKGKFLLSPTMIIVAFFRFEKKKKVCFSCFQVIFYEKDALEKNNTPTICSFFLYIRTTLLYSMLFFFFSFFYMCLIHFRADFLYIIDSSLCPTGTILGVINTTLEKNMNNA
jgi:hypothetical protein